MESESAIALLYICEASVLSRDGEFRAIGRSNFPISGFEYFVCFGYCVYGRVSVIVKETTKYMPAKYLHTLPAMAAQVFPDRGLCLLRHKILALCFKNNHIKKDINYVEPKSIA
ncbi:MULTISPECIES: hypothetical protein [unclassified Microcoleus]|uniref:hypothetical protein n=1 Tax=unclassified Microcoleus TaxID=2642155 RepID=UPI002FD591AC